MKKEHDKEDNSEVLNQINKKLDKIMALIDDLNAKVVELQEALDTEQAQIKTLVDGQNVTIAGLNAQVTELQGMLADGATPTQLQAVIDNLNTIKTDLEGTV